ncbi:MAG: PH domain-containing protein [Dehalococcoidia bacterium]
MYVCEKCETEIPEGNNFCGNCGEQISDKPLQSATQEIDITPDEPVDTTNGELVKQSSYAWVLPIVPWMIFIVVSLFIDFLTFGLLQLGIALLFIVPRWISYSRTAFILTSEYITIKRGTFTGSDSLDLPISALQEVNSKPGILGQSLGYTSLTLVLKDGRSAHLSYVPINAPIRSHIESRMTDN